MIEGMGLDEGDMYLCAFPSLNYTGAHMMLAPTSTLGAEPQTYTMFRRTCSDMYASGKKAKHTRAFRAFPKFAVVSLGVHLMKGTRSHTTQWSVQTRRAAFVRYSNLCRVCWPTHDRIQRSFAATDNCSVIWIHAGWVQMRKRIRSAIAAFLSY